MSPDEYPHLAGTHFENQESSKSFALGGKIMLGAIVILICVVFFMVALHLYARWYLLRARRRQLVRRRNRLAEARRATQFVFYVDDNPTTLIIADPGNMGLDSSVLRSLPVFNYSPKTHPESLDCAVCLSEFEDGEKGRLLPKCNHAFHIDCIDMWFNSHSTCPLCRSPVERVSEPEMSGSGLIPVEPAGSSSALCEECHHHHHHHEEGNSSTTSLGSRRKGFDVRIEVPNRNELEDELTLSSPASGAFRSPGARLFSQSMKRILSMGGRKTPTGESSTTPQSGRKTPTGESSTTPSGAATSCSMTELDLEQGLSELPPSRTPK